MRSLTDRFDTGIDEATWNTQGSPVATTDGLKLDTSTSEVGVYSKEPYDFNLSEIYAKVTPTQMTASSSLYFTLTVEHGDAQTNLLEFVLIGSTLHFRKTRNGARDEAKMPYNVSLNAWWRLRERNGVCYWDTSPDGATWTNHRQAAHGMNVTTTYFSVCGYPTSTPTNFGYGSFGAY